MPFQGELTLPPSPPNVQVFFFGLLLLFPEANGSCSVGVVPAQDHILSIDCWEVRPNPPNQPLLRLNGDLRDVSIQVMPSKNERVRKYTGVISEKHFGLAIDFKQIHPTSNIVPSGFDTIISLVDGWLHTAIPTDPSKIGIQLIPPVGVPTERERIAASIGANIYMQATEKLELRWTSMDGRSKVLQLPLDGHPGSTYEIHVSNTPYLQVGKVEHDDFRKYYDVLDVPEPERFKMIFTPKIVGLNPQASVDAPCMPGHHGG